MAKRILVLLLLAAVVAGLYFGFFSKTKSTSSTSKVQDAQVLTDPKFLKLIKVEVLNAYADDYGIAHVYGEVANSSNQVCKLALIRITTYDKDNNMMKQLRVRVRDITPGGTKTFDITTGIFRTGFRAEAELLGVAF